jgi:DNA polymerase I-like protein with 3'-5' exonuclease and polymerase domains
MGSAFRRAFEPGRGRTLVVCDLSQIQLRIAAEIANDPVMIEAYLHGRDIHTHMARKITGSNNPTSTDRAIAKSANFGLLFGAGAATFANYARSNYGIELTPEEAASIRQAWLSEFAGIRAWHRTVGAALQSAPQGITTRTIAGRTRQGLTHYAEALCSPIQGTEADIVKTAMGLLYARRDQAPQRPALFYATPGWFPVAVIHDELILECDEKGAQEMADWLRSVLIEAGSMHLKVVPVDADSRVQKNWGNS